MFSPELWRNSFRSSLWGALFEELFSNLIYYRALKINFVTIFVITFNFSTKIGFIGFGDKRSSLSEQFDKASCFLIEFAKFSFQFRRTIRTTFYELRIKRAFKCRQDFWIHPDLLPDFSKTSTNRL